MALNALDNVIQTDIIYIMYISIKSIPLWHKEMHAIIRRYLKNWKTINKFTADIWHGIWNFGSIAIYDRVVFISYSLIYSSQWTSQALYHLLLHPVLISNALVIQGLSCQRFCDSLAIWSDCWYMRSTTVIYFVWSSPVYISYIFIIPVFCLHPSKPLCSYQTIEQACHRSFVFTNSIVKFDGDTIW